MSAAPAVGFLYVPAAINALRSLSRFDRDLLAKVIGLAKGDRGCIASNEWLSRAMECSERTVKRGLARLIAGGYLTSEIRPTRYVSGGRLRHLKAGDNAPEGGGTCGATHAERTLRGQQTAEYSDTREIEQAAAPAPAAAVSDTEIPRREPAPELLEVVTVPESRADGTQTVPAPADLWGVAEAALADRNLPEGARHLAMARKQIQQCLDAAADFDRSPAWVVAICAIAREKGQVPGAMARSMILGNTDIEIQSPPGTEAAGVKERQQPPPGLSPAEIAHRRHLGRLRVVQTNPRDLARHILGPLVSEEALLALEAEAGKEPSPPKAPPPSREDPLTEMLRNAFPSMPSAAPIQAQDAEYRAQIQAAKVELADRRRGVQP